MTGCVLELKNVHHAFEDGVEVLHDIDLAIAPGEIVCLLGPSGCGKTTTLRLAAGLEECQQGQVLINGNSVSDGVIHVPPEKRGVGLVFQDTALFPHLTVAENIAFGLGALNARARAERVGEMLRQVSMEPYAESYPHVLSGGQQQRVALARALAPDPKIILLDEPFSGLDAQLRALIREETLTLLKAHGVTALVVTHDPEEAMYVADRIAVMNKGRIEQIGCPDDLYCHPVNPFVTRFFSSTNRFTTTVRGRRVATPFGPLEVPEGLADGSLADVLIRPEALHIAPADGSPLSGGIGSMEARVITVRMLRRAVFMHLCMGEFEGQHLHFHARHPGHHTAEEGANVRVTLDLEQTFIFPSVGN
ncbi:MAG: iron(III) transport system ATP-binding protein [Alphaproteobacteria bacterium]